MQVKQQKENIMAAYGKTPARRKEQDKPVGDRRKK